MEVSVAEVNVVENRVEALAQHQVKRVFEATLNQVEVEKPVNQKTVLAFLLQNHLSRGESTRKQVNSLRLASAKKITRK
jgi:hypothetical protein